MKKPIFKSWRCAYTLTLAAVLPFAAADDDRPKKFRSTSAHSLTSPDYERPTLPNGERKPETYALAIGQMLDPTESDASLTALSHEEIAHAIAAALHRSDYRAESDPEKTDLMIVFNWGRTVPYHDGGMDRVSTDRMAEAMNAINNTEMSLGIGLPSENAGTAEYQGDFESMRLMSVMAERARREANDYNARLLGFAPDLYDQYASSPVGGPQRMLFDELVEEIESPRYFVILEAYDFKKLTQKKEKDLRWITRFSMRASGRQFDQELANMANSAARLFGTRSGKIERHLLPGRGQMGEIEVVDETPEDATPVQ